MSRLARFGAYAAAFEEAYESDDWSRVEPFFTEDAAYETGLGPPFAGRVEGRDAILAYFRDVLDRFDRRFGSREVSLLEGPREDGDAVWVRGSATYRTDGLPDLVFELEEIATFEGDRIRLLEDRYAPEVGERIGAYLKAHGAKLGIPTDG